MWINNYIYRPTMIVRLPPEISQVSLALAFKAKLMKDTQVKDPSKRKALRPRKTFIS